MHSLSGSKDVHIARHRTRTHGFVSRSPTSTLLYKKPAVRQLSSLELCPNKSDDIADTQLLDRRKLFAISLLSVSAIMTSHSSPSMAYTKTFPGELQATDGILDERQMKRQYIAQRQSKVQSSFIPKTLSRPLGAMLWGMAIWFLCGSRSNPLVTPIANILYDDKEEDWLKDRNDGLFADLPFALLAALVIIFFALGVGTDNLLTLLSQGNHNASLQLAGVSLIGAGVLELGRIASGEKKPTRGESDRETLLETEFADFAAERLQAGGNCHRNEVVAAFRRYYSKYRRADESLADLEIEQLLRAWSRSQGLEMTNAGFYYGFKINKDADVFK
ncbi:hypothetical protein MPSEU_000274400 [Mayamaea pseudoterrestris]|nr:hypothetical protein MPSEU_000274400 [Mayamaea pseudoterrestris]